MDSHKNKNYEQKGTQKIHPIKFLIIYSTFTRGYNNDKRTI